MLAVEPRIEREYWAARQAVALMDCSHLGRVAMSGADCLDLLHRLSTQDLRQLQVGQGAVTVLTTEKGRILDLLTVYHLGEKHLLLTSPGNQQAVSAWLEKYTIIEDVATRDETDATALLAFFGPRAQALAQGLAGSTGGNLPMLHHVSAAVAGVQVRMARFQAPVGHGFYLFLSDRGHLAQVRREVLEQGEALGIQPVGTEAYDILRIEAGQPAFGREMDERYNPLEAQLRHHISFDKGCYIGQEVVARLDTYQKVQRALLGLKLPQGPVALPGTPLECAGRQAGFVTSAAFSPTLGQPIALVYLRLRYAQPGLHLTLAADGGGGEAEVVPLPFLS